MGTSEYKYTFIDLFSGAGGLLRGFLDQGFRPLVSLDIWQPAIDTHKFNYPLDEQLTSLGMIGKRKPSAITTNAKASYVRDEPKIWNKFGLVKQRSANRYFFERSGYHFDWERITAILRNGGNDL